MPLKKEVDTSDDDNGLQLKSMPSQSRAGFFSEGSSSHVALTATEQKSNVSEDAPPLLPINESLQSKSTPKTDTHVSPQAQASNNHAKPPLRRQAYFYKFVYLI